jgi:hypothetical protein
MDNTSSPRSAIWPVAVAATGIAALVVSILAVAWVDRESASPPPRRYPNAVAALCAAAGAAAANNRTEARRVFVGEARDRLVRVTERASARDRATARRLGRLTERVETNLANPKAGLVEDLVDLADATRSALRVVGERVPPPCEIDDR